MKYTISLLLVLVAITSCRIIPSAPLFDNYATYTMTFNLDTSEITDYTNNLDIIVDIVCSNYHSNFITQPVNGVIYMKFKTPSFDVPIITFTGEYDGIKDMPEFIGVYFSNYIIPGVNFTAEHDITLYNKDNFLSDYTIGGDVYLIINDLTCSFLLEKYEGVDLKKVEIVSNVIQFQNLNQYDRIQLYIYANKNKTKFFKYYLQ